MKVNVLIFLLLSTAVSAQTGNNFIHRSGNEVHDTSGKVIHLNGVNLGGWLLWEGWIWGGGFKSETKMDQKIGSLYGKDSIALFKEKVHQNYIREEDIRLIAGLKMNVVRIAFNHTLFETDENPYVYKESGFQQIDSLLSWCEKYNVYAVLDLHAAPGGQNGFFISDPDKEGLWEFGENQKRTVALWYTLAKRYADRTIIAGFDLLNEPKTKDNAQLMGLYQRITDTIRKADSNHMLILEGNNLAQKFDFFDTGTPEKPSFVSRIDANTIFSFHYYTWFNEKKKTRTLIPHATFGKQTNVPMWCGEWGEDTEVNLDELSTLLHNPDYNFSGSAFWTWKKVYINNKRFPLSEIRFSPDAQQVIKFIARNGKQPTPAQAKLAWNEIFSAIRSENCVLNEQMMKFFFNLY